MSELLGIYLFSKAYNTYGMKITLSIASGIQVLLILINIFGYLFTNYEQTDLALISCFIHIIMIFPSCVLFIPLYLYE